LCVVSQQLLLGDRDVKSKPLFEIQPLDDSFNRFNDRRISKVALRLSDLPFKTTGRIQKPTTPTWRGTTSYPFYPQQKLFFILFYLTFRIIFIVVYRISSYQILWSIEQVSTLG